jgi:hypothetical protein
VYLNIYLFEDIILRQLQDSTPAHVPTQIKYKE